MLQSQRGFLVHGSKYVLLFVKKERPVSVKGSVVAMAPSSASAVAQLIADKLHQRRAAAQMADVGSSAAMPELLTNGKVA